MSTNMFHDQSSSSSEEDGKPFNPIKAAADAKRKIGPADPEDPLYKAITAALNDPSPRQPKPAAPKREARYIGKLVEMAAHRKEEGTRVSERRILVKQREEDEMFADKERFVTSAYRKKLQQDNLRDTRERVQEQVEKERRSKGISGFYGSLFNGENLAMGGNVEQRAKLAPQPSDGPKASSTRKQRRTRFGDAESLATMDTQVEADQQPKAEPKRRGLRRNDAKSVEEYRLRYFERRAKRLSLKPNG